MNRLATTTLKIKANIKSVILVDNVEDAMSAIYIEAEVPELNAGIKGIELIGM